MFYYEDHIPSPTSYSFPSAKGRQARFLPHYLPQGKNMMKKEVLIKREGFQKFLRP
jgi:hypothetical protein